MFRDSGVAKKRVFSKKMIISGAVTPWKITGQCST
jgi:hypothetical protein